MNKIHNIERFKQAALSANIPDNFHQKKNPYHRFGNLMAVFGFSLLTS